MDYDIEARALKVTLDFMSADYARIEIRRLDDDELDALSDALDQLAALVDEEAIRRVEKRA